MSKSVSNPMSKGEFIALIAMMFATIAFSIDAMLPALPEIGATLSPDNINRAQLIITSFVLGMGIGTFFTGPISDAFGRKPVIFGGVILYIISAAAAWAAQSLELALLARVTMGLGAAGPRVVAMAVVRDLYSGREMARVVSIAMMIFTLVPAVAPMLGSVIIAFSSWRGIFAAFAAFALIIALWMGVRLPETLERQDRRPVRPALMAAALKEMVTHPTVRLSIIAQCLCLGMLFTMITLVQPAYDVVFDRAESFPYWFFGVALVAGTGSLLNAVLVVRLGMRRMVTWALASQIGLASAMLVLESMPLDNSVAFGLFVTWQTSVFFMAGVTLGNLNAMGMEPMGHIAGMAASVMGAISTVVAAAIAAPVGLLFDGSLLPLTAGILIMAFLGFLVMLHMARVEARLPAV
ncbi:MULTISPECIES: MFS transporter [Rhodobacterales]|jgi:DHA1 family bicyclomycin/chloramphenicol resistance-like MFS transporter|uniref:MFS transporter n=1 Tax=Rhodobacterales TaxID=204455 RepID=UPI00237EEFDF|nr:MFS transporter [Phaeobacter gallaeciensis]MDE4139327.1 MFS transporter [Phaeobacter gallaeciensis]MDE4147615.1 MFS transporter [Phaeobacter gallaeciensis]MDE4151834.1 MFS transporter [Phaeobacter gallaeciensis]MDE4256298.1 MFS transporter [Phaeobacter gallaeciensis]MDE4260658.1 MFS transporter [Phaeobacter gallaeciensis]